MSAPPPSAPPTAPLSATRTGRFLVVEGPEAAGKTTLVRALAQRLQARGEEPVMVREPGGTPLAEGLRRELLNAARQWTPEMELLYLATARADLVSTVIRPALARGAIVISDRYDLSTMAYQAAGRGLPTDAVRWVNGAATGGLAPDLTIILDLDRETARQRQEHEGKGLDRLERESDDFHTRVAAAYRAVRGPGVHHLDGAVPPDELERAAWTLLEQALSTSEVAAVATEPMGGYHGRSRGDQRGGGA